MEGGMVLFLSLPQQADKRLAQAVQKHHPTAEVAAKIREDCRVEKANKQDKSSAEEVSKQDKSDERRKVFARRETSLLQLYYSRRIAKTHITPQQQQLLLQSLPPWRTERIRTIVIRYKKGVVWILEVYRKERQRVKCYLPM